VSHLRQAHNQSPGQYRKAFPDAEVASPIALELLRYLDRSPIRDPDVTLASVVNAFTSKEMTSDSFWKDLRAQLSWYSVPAGADQFIPEGNKLFRFTENAKFIVLGMASGKHVFISGPTGCGKTEEVRQVFSKLQIPIRRANMHGDVTYGTFIGAMKANTQGTYFDYGLLPQAMRAGYPILLDEIDFTPPNISSVLFPILEKGGELYIPETGEHIRPTRGFGVFATGNTGGKGDSNGSFTGTEVLNTAFLDRFSIKLSAKYMPPDAEVELLKQANQNLSKAYLEKVVKFANELRLAFANGDLSFTWSTRKVLDYIEFLAVMPPDDALDLTILNWLDKDDRPFVENLVKKHLLRALV